MSVVIFRPVCTQLYTEAKMSKIKVEFDTKTKELSVKQNGKEVENVNRIEFYGLSDGKGMLDLVIHKYDENESINETYTLYANEDELRPTQNKELRKAIAKLISPDMV